MIRPLNAPSLVPFSFFPQPHPFTKVTTARKVPEKTTRPKTNATSVPTPTRPRPSNAKFAAKVSTKTNWGGINANGVLWGNFCPTKEVLPCFTMIQTIVKSVVQTRTLIKQVNEIARDVSLTMSSKTAEPMPPYMITSNNASERVPWASTSMR